MANSDHKCSEQAESCVCFTEPYPFLVEDKYLGMEGNFAEVSLQRCPICNQLWLRYFYEVEAFTASGRWYLGAINADQASQLTVENAKVTLENLSWYLYGGSYYDGRSGKTSGKIFLNP